MEITTVRRFVLRFEEGGTQHYSVRRRPNGAYQVYRDDPFAGIREADPFEDLPISGLYGDLATAEAELLRMRPGVEADDSNS